MSDTKPAPSCCKAGIGSTPVATFGPVTSSSPAGLVGATLAALTDATLPLPTRAGVVAGPGGLAL